MQFLLLLKQTIESNFDPGAIQLNGNNISFTNVNQIFSSKKLSDMSIRFSMSFDNGKNITSIYGVDSKRNVAITAFSYKEIDGNLYILREEGKDADLKEVYKNSEIIKGMKDIINDNDFENKRDRCFLVSHIVFKANGNRRGASISSMTIPSFSIFRAKDLISKSIHLPGLRGNPERNYPMTSAEGRYPGRFENYVAGIIWDWQVSKSAKFKRLNAYLFDLGLAGKLSAKRVSDSALEIYVSKSINNKSEMVSIADVGLGVSQILPILVALIQFDSETTIFIEQPEIHLHPRAQAKLAEIFVNAISLGSKLVIETHSSNLLLAIQTQIAKGEIKPEDVSLNWFTKNSDGQTCVSAAKVKGDGSFGDWPEDFDDTLLSQQDAYLSAVEDLILKGEIEIERLGDA